MHTYTQTSKHAYARMHTDARMHAWWHACVHASAHMHMDACANMNAPTSVGTHTCPHMHMSKHKATPPRMMVCTRMRMSSSRWPSWVSRASLFLPPRFACVVVVIVSAFTSLPTVALTAPFADRHGAARKGISDASARRTDCAGASEGLSPSPAHPPALAPTSALTRGPVQAAG